MIKFKKNEAIAIAKADNKVLEQGIQIGKILIDELKKYDNKCMTSRVTNLIKKDTGILSLSIDYDYSKNMILNSFITDRYVQYINNNGIKNIAYSNYSNITFNIEVDENKRLNYKMTKIKILKNIDKLKSKIINIDKLENDYIKLEEEREEIILIIEEFNSKVSEANLIDTHRINIRY